MFASAAVLFSSVAFTGCKDYDDDINNLQSQIDANKKLIDDINNLVKGGAVITGVTKITDGNGGIRITLSDNRTFDITNGANGAAGAPGAPGKDADVWTIVEKDGKYVWAKNGEATEFPAQGPAGAPGAAAQQAPTIYYYPCTDKTSENYGHWIKVTKEADKEPVEEVQAEKWLANGTLTGVDTGTEIVISGLIDADGNETSFTISKTSDLRHLVFRPDGYLNGVEATEYNFTYISSSYTQTANNAIPNYNSNAGGFKGNIVTNNVSVTYVIPKVAFNSYTSLGRNAYYIMTNGVVNYEVNPANANTDLGYKFITKNAANYSRAEAIKVEGVEAVNGNLAVTYSLSTGYLFNNNGQLVLNQDPNTSFNLFALEATVNAEKGEVVTSDFAVIVPKQKTFASIAFTSPKNTTASLTTGITNATDQKDLTVDPVAAISFGPNLGVPYNCGTYKLANVLCVHFAGGANGGHNAMSLADACRLYKLTPSYTLIGYKVGANATSDSQFAKISEEGVITPCYVATDGSQVEITAATEEAGKSAIGRHPMVKVNLTDENGNVVLTGIAIIELTDKGAVAGEHIVNTKTVSYICANTVKTSWTQITGSLLAPLGISEANFRNQYKWAPSVSGSGYNANPYILVDGQYVQPTYKKNNNTYNWNLGTMSWAVDQAEGTTNPSLTWTANIANAAHYGYDYASFIASQPGRTVVFYTPFTVANSNDILWVGVQVTLREMPVVTIGVKNNDYWFGNQVRLNTFAPNNGVQSITNFARNFNDAYRGNKAVIVSSSEGYNFSDPSKSTYIPSQAWFFFTANQKTLQSLDAANTSYILGLYDYGQGADPRYDDTRLVARKKVGNNTGPQQTIAIINPATGVITYQDNTVAKEVLNLYASTDAEHQLVAEVVMYPTYGACELMPDYSETIEARWLRPLNAVSGETKGFVDAVPGGSSIPVGQIFNIKDWQGNALIAQPVYDTDKDSPTYGQMTQGYRANVINNVNIYDYYQISSVKVDLDPTKVMTDMGGVYGTLKAANQNLVLKVNNATSYSFTGTFSELLSTNVTYYNNGNAVSNDFNLYIPVKVNYVWGTTADCFVKVPVAKTPNQTSK